MKCTAYFRKHTLRFKFSAGTSRGVLNDKTTWFLFIQEKDRPGVKGVGEAAPIKGLSIDGDEVQLEKKLQEVCAWINDRSMQDILQNDWREILQLQRFPSIIFAMETALFDLKNGAQHVIFDNSFVTGASAIPINGLIWMGDESFMSEQIEKKLQDGYHCLKMKIGAIDFVTELKLLKDLRARYTVTQLQLRVDANGAFTPENVFEHLEQLAPLQIHSIEQPIKAGQFDAIKKVCADSHVPVAFDEELIGVESRADKIKLLDTLQPPYIVLKPSLHGGLASCKEWIQLAEERKIGWWITSALESNIGLNAIAQFTAMYDVKIPQGLGTGQLYFNNIVSPLGIKRAHLWYNPMHVWDTSMIGVDSNSEQ